MAITADQISKVRDYLLANGQQELVGHLDGMEQELNQLRLDVADDPNRLSAQEFQDQYKQNDEESKPVV